MPLDFRSFPQIGETPDAILMAKDTTDLRGGMNTKLHATAIGDSEAVLIQNFLLKQGGVGERRTGTTNVMNAPSAITGSILGLSYWNPPANPESPKLFAASENRFWYWTGSGAWVEAINGTPLGTKPVRLVQGWRSSPTFEHAAWIFQEGASNVYEFDGTASLTTVSGGAGGSSTSVPTGTDAIFWLGRLWVAEDQENNGEIRYSEFGQPTNFDAAKGFTINPQDKLTKMVQWFNTGILLFYRNSIWVLAIDQANFEIELVDNTQVEAINYDIGCVAGDTVAQAGSDFFFLSRNGVHRLSKTERDKAVGVAVPISDKIEAEINRINWSSVDQATGVVWDQFYLLAVPVDASATNNLVLVYDIREDAWSTITGWEVGDWEIARLGANEEKLYFGTASTSGSGEVYEAFGNLVGTDDGTDVTARIDTKRYDFGTTARRKQFRWLDIFTDPSTGGSIDVYAAADNDSLQLLETLDVGVGVPTLPIFLPFSLVSSSLQRNRVYLDSLGHPREVRFRFESVGDSLVKILYYTLEANPGEEEYS